MEFVFSIWYFVMIALVGGIVASLIILFKMNKKDRVLIDEFIKSASDTDVKNSNTDSKLDKNEESKTVEQSTENSSK